MDVVEEEEEDDNDDDESLAFNNRKRRRRKSSTMRLYYHHSQRYGYLWICLLLIILGEQSIMSMSFLRNVALATKLRKHHPAFLLLLSPNAHNNESHHHHHPSKKNTTTSKQQQQQQHCSSSSSSSHTAIPSSRRYASTAEDEVLLASASSTSTDTDSQQTVVTAKENYKNKESNGKVATAFQPPRKEATLEALSSSPSNVNGKATLFKNESTQTKSSSRNNEFTTTTTTSWTSKILTGIKNAILPPLGSQENESTSPKQAPATSAAAAAAAASAHLQLTSNPNNGKKDEKENKNDNNTEPVHSSRRSTITIHTYIDNNSHNHNHQNQNDNHHHEKTNQNSSSTWVALNTSKLKFLAFLHYHNLTHVTKHDISTERVTPNTESSSLSSKTSGSASCFSSDSSSSVVVLNTAAIDEMRETWRTLWKQGRLLTDRTELLAVYPSDAAAAARQQQQRQQQNTSNANRRRGGFVDLLYLYVDRVVAIVRDEIEDQQQQQPPPNGSNNNNKNHKDVLMDWLEQNYGVTETARLQHSTFRKFSQPEQLSTLQHFLNWFRSEFPYYYDQCSACGASIKHDNAVAAAAAAEEEEKEKERQREKDTTQTRKTTEKDDLQIQNEKVQEEDEIIAGGFDDDEEGEDEEEEDEDEDDHRTFVGYIYPSDKELVGKASRTELYKCHKCDAFTLFPRYNSAIHVLESKRGRCGEYSMLLFRFLRALGHPSRWVVDWADHVWAEVAIADNTSKDKKFRWIHLDPCEAAVDENLIYQSWGKKQTYILGFYLPPMQQQSQQQQQQPSPSIPFTDFEIPLIEDITHTYTSDKADVINKRREETKQEVVNAIENATLELEKKLQEETAAAQQTK